MRQLKHFGIEADTYGENAFVDKIERAWYGYTPEQQARMMKYKERLRDKIKRGEA